jgi:hypothetical protein
MEKSPTAADDSGARCARGELDARRRLLSPGSTTIRRVALAHRRHPMRASYLGSVARRRKCSSKRAAAHLRGETISPWSRRRGPCHSAAKKRGERRIPFKPAEKRPYPWRRRCSCRGGARSCRRPRVFRQRGAHLRSRSPTPRGRQLLAPMTTSPRTRRGSDRASADEVIEPPLTTGWSDTLHQVHGVDHGRDMAAGVFASTSGRTPASRDQRVSAGGATPRPTSPSTRAVVLRRCGVAAEAAVCRRRRRRRRAPRPLLVLRQLVNFAGDALGSRRRPRPSLSPVGLHYGGAGSNYSH